MCITITRNGKTTFAFRTFTGAVSLKDATLLGTVFEPIGLPAPSPVAPFTGERIETTIK
jgi:hypothetical protein